jgi:predicted kinase
MIIRPTLFMLVGLPGSGKSTYVTQLQYFHKKLNCTNPLHIVSLDTLIMESALTNETYADAFVRLKESGELNALEREMMMNVRSFAYSQLEDHKGICVWDQTNLTVKSRMRKLTIFNPYIWRREALIFDVSRDQLDVRLAHRAQAEQKFIGKSIIDSMQASFEYPTEKEGFDAISWIGENLEDA